jgi:hypothetical protein
MRDKIGAWMRDRLCDVWGGARCVSMAVGVCVVLGTLAHVVVRVAQLPAPWPVVDMEERCAAPLLTLRDFVGLPVVSRMLLVVVPADWICGPAPVAAAPDAESPGASQPDPVVLERLAQTTTPEEFVAFSQHIHQQVETAVVRNPDLLPVMRRHVGTFVATCLERQMQHPGTAMGVAIAACTPMSLSRQEGSH